MKVTLIAAISKNYVIGKDNGLPWHLPNDLKFFKEKTLGHAIIMGRKTFESINKKALPKRTNILVTSQPGYEAFGCTNVPSLYDAVKAVHRDETEAFIVGGSSLFSEALEKNYATHMYLTIIDAEVDGDVFFPKFDKTKWKEVWREEHQPDEKHTFAYAFTLWERK